MTDAEQGFETQQTILGRDPAGFVKASERIRLRADEATTPLDGFFVMHHGSAPAPLDPSAWRLRLGGAVARPHDLTLDALRSLPAHTVRAVIECAGNSRRSFEPPIDIKLAFVMLGDGTVATGEWTGARLADVLELAGASPTAQQVLATPEPPPPPPPGAWAMPLFQKAVPIGKALHPDTIVAWAYDGEPIPHLHGGPVRLVVPGWYAAWWTKWLTALEVLETDWDGYFQTERYTYHWPDGSRSLVTEVGVKSLIVEPAAGSLVGPGPVELAGLAWSGTGPIERVEISADGGASWQGTTLDVADGPWTWVRWRATWTPDRPGDHELLVRARDGSGAVQPDAARWNAVGYGFNGVARSVVTVGGDR